MPKKVEEALKRKGWTNAQVYGYINKHYKKVNGKWVKR